MTVSYTKDKAFILERITEILDRSKKGSSISEDSKTKLYAIATRLFEESDKSLKAVLPQYIKSLYNILGNEIMEKLPSKKISFIYDCIDVNSTEKPKKKQRK